VTKSDKKEKLLLKSDDDRTSIVEEELHKEWPFFLPML